MRVGIISDTHGLLRPEAIEALEGADHIIHAGDIGSSWIVPRLREIAPVSAIRGNVDREDWAAEFPESLELNLAGQDLFVLHDLAELAFDPAERGYRLVISGHSHRPKVESRDGVLRINPGSAGPRRFRLPVTLALLTISGEGPSGPEIRHLLDGVGPIRPELEARRDGFERTEPAAGAAMETKAPPGYPAGPRPTALAQGRDRYCWRA